MGKHLDANAFTAAVRKVLAGDTSFPFRRGPPAVPSRFGPAHGIPVTPAELGLDTAPGLGAGVGCWKDCPTRSSRRKLGLTENTVKEHVSARRNDWACAYADAGRCRAMERFRAAAQ